MERVEKPVKKAKYVPTEHVRSPVQQGRLIVTVDVLTFKMSEPTVVSVVPLVRTVRSAKVVNVCSTAKRVNLFVMRLVSIHRPTASTVVSAKIPVGPAKSVLPVSVS